VHIVLPIGSFAETAGTFVNVEGAGKLDGRREAAGREPAGLEGAASARESAEPAGLDYASSEEVLDELKTLCAAAARRHVRREPRASARAERLPSASGSICRLTRRRAGARDPNALAKTKDGQAPAPCSDMWQWSPLAGLVVRLDHGVLGVPLLTAVQILMVMIGLILVMAFYTLAERKVIGWIQSRRGPNRVNLFWDSGSRPAVRRRRQAAVQGNRDSRPTRTDFCSGRAVSVADTPRSPFGR
jgi:hypothetical protein